MRTAHVCNVILLSAFLVAAPAAGGPPPVPSLSPSRADVERARAAFLKLSRPLAYKYVVDRPARDPFEYALSHIALHKDAKALAEGTPAMVLVYALWPFLTNQTYDAEAFIILQGALEPKMAGDWGLDFIDAAHPGSWPRVRPYAIDKCRRLCRSVLGQPEWWYPHPVLFDRGRVLAESKTNAVVRAAHIEAMVKALADPKIRTENPLEANNILLILDALKAREAAETFVQYALFDWSTGADFRRRSDSTNDFSDVHGLTLPIVTLIPRLGAHALPLVLERFGNATAEEYSVQRGGGALPVLAVMYFIGCGYSESASIAAIDTFLHRSEELGDAQVSALRGIQHAISAKLYRPAWLTRVRTQSYRAWAAPVATNVATTDN